MAPALVLVVIVALLSGSLVVALRPATTSAQRALRVIASATFAGLLAYVVLNPLLAILIFLSVLVGRGVVEPRIRDGRMPSPAALIAVMQAGLPFAVALWVNYQRPDLMQPMLDYVFGYAVLGLIVLLVGGGAAATLFVSSRTDSPVALLGSCAASLLFCTFPSILLVLFGPIVFAFIFGKVDS